jgi:hypothetical protein
MNFNTTGKVFDLSVLHELLKAEFGENFNFLLQENANLKIYYQNLSPSQEVQLEQLVSNHLDNFGSTFDFTFLATRNSQQQNITFSQNLLQDWMRKNTLEGINIMQSLWVFSRFEQFIVSCDFGQKHVDLFKMFQSGALPTVYYCILQVQPDTMTEDYHWLTQERLDWVKEKIEAHLGNGMATHIQSLNNSSN